MIYSTKPGSTIQITRTKKRRTVIVEWLEFSKRWVIRTGPSVIGYCATRRGAVALAATNCRNIWHLHRHTSKILIRNKRTGEFSKDKRTYGKDDPKVKG